MVNLVAAYEKSMVHNLMKMAGITPHTLEIEAGTIMNIWVPKESMKKNSKKTVETLKPTKPVVVLLHGFAGNGIFTWQFQVASLTSKYSVYVPDFLFFGGSITDKPDRSATFQAEFMAKGLRKLGIERCTVVGFSYGGMVAFKMAEMYPDLVEALVVTGGVPALTDSITNAALEEHGYNSLSEFLLPTSVKEFKAVFKIAAHIKLWLPHRLFKDFLQVMFSNRKERSELLEALVVSNNTNIPNFPQRIHFLGGENDLIIKLELAQKTKEQLGSKATLCGIKKAGHLVLLERPCVYNRRLKQFLATLHAGEANK